LLSAALKYFPASLHLPPAVNEYLTPFMNRMGAVFLVSLALAVVVSLVTPSRADTDTIDTRGVSYKTRTGFNVAALGVILILVALYATWW
jgi:SSS family solute:Na+ symporter